MANMIEALNLNDLIIQSGHDASSGFESLYSRLHTADPSSSVVKQIEQRVEDYFSSLTLPQYPTIYDFLLLSLRQKDAVFTFNWDPFLAEAYDRHAAKLPLPSIFHLHGNVRVGYCQNCDKAMPRANQCPACGASPIPTRLLYPVEEKDYANGPYLVSQWKMFREFVARALIVTIFGYSAPKTDKEAIAVFKSAWKTGAAHKLIHHLEIIDVQDSSVLTSHWAPFSHFHHYKVRRSFFDSLLARYPRRSCEAIFQSAYEGKFVEPIAWAGNLDGLTLGISELTDYEGQ